MDWSYKYLFFLLAYFPFVYPSHAQQFSFNRVMPPADKQFGTITGILQDRQGYMWISTFAGLYRYDGLDFKPYIDSSLKSYITCLAIDTNNIIWLGTYGSGIVKFNPVTNTFIFFQHQPHNASALLNDTVTCIMKDHLDNIWIGTRGGLDKLDRTTGKFTHYINENNDASSLSSNYINTIYEDKQGVIWIGCGSAFKDTSEKNGGLNRLDLSTGKFTRYFNKTGDASSLISNKVMTVFEDSKQNFWVGTGRSGLHIMDRKKGEFIRISYASSNLEKPKASSVVKKDLSFWDAVTFISEDNKGNVWFGSFYHGINCYNSVLKNIIRFGNMKLGDNPEHYKEDSISGFRENGAILSVCSKDGTFWLATEWGNFYRINQPPGNIPYYDIEAAANSFYEENDSILWIATGTKGLLKRNIKSGKDMWITNANGNMNIPPDNNILGLRADADSNLWIATYTGLYKLNLENDIFTRFVHDVNKSNSPAGDRIHFLYTDNQNLWLGVSWHGLDKMNILNGTITHYSHNDKDSNSLSSSLINYITKDKNNDIWIATYTGLDRLNQNTNKFTHYLKQSNVLSTCVDTDGMIWASTTDGFYYFDAHKNSFEKYVNQNAPLTIRNVLHILEDDQHNLWLTTGSAILKIDRKTNSVNVYGNDYGVHYNSFYIGDNYKLKNGQLLIGDQNGYYLISPLALNLTKTMVLNLTGFKIGDEEVKVSQDAAFNVNTAMSQAEAIKLNYKQNIFSFTFSTTDYANSSEIKYLVMLENYDNTWRDIGTEHKAYFFSVPPGNYVFHVKAINPNGIWTEKSISVIISPPWWSTWWFRVTAVVFVIAVLYSLIRWRVKEKFRLQLEQSEKEKQLAMLNQKTSELEAQALRAEMDQVLKLQQMRTRIASDLHDDIGSTLTSISYYSELVKMLLKEDDASVKPMLDKIGGSARNTVNAMSDIVWIINPKNDTTENLVSRMKHYAAEMLGERNMSYKFYANEETEKLELNMQQRKNIYLVYKEAVHNAVKYAQCSKVEIDFTATDHELSLSICDNGKGFDIQQTNDGNGLINMKKRAEEINAYFEICSAENRGTQIKLTCKIT